MYTYKEKANLSTIIPKELKNYKQVSLYKNANGQ